MGRRQAGGMHRVGKSSSRGREHSHRQSSASEFRPPADGVETDPCGTGVADALSPIATLARLSFRSWPLSPTEAHRRMGGRGCSMGARMFPTLDGFSIRKLDSRPEWMIFPRSPCVRCGLTCRYSTGSAWTGRRESGRDFATVRRADKRCGYGLKVHSSVIEPAAAER